LILPLTQKFISGFCRFMFTGPHSHIVLFGYIYRLCILTDLLVWDLAINGHLQVFSVGNLLAKFKISLVCVTMKLEILMKICSHFFHHVCWRHLSTVKTCYNNLLIMEYGYFSQFLLIVHFKWKCQNPHLYKMWNMSDQS